MIGINWGLVGGGGGGNAFAPAIAAIGQNSDAALKAEAQAAAERRWQAEFGLQKRSTEQSMKLRDEDAARARTQFGWTGEDRSANAPVRSAEREVALARAGTEKLQATEFAAGSGLRDEQRRTALGATRIEQSKQGEYERDAPLREAQRKVAEGAASGTQQQQAIEAYQRLGSVLAAVKTPEEFSRVTGELRQRGFDTSHIENVAREKGVPYALDYMKMMTNAGAAKYGTLKDGEHIYSQRTGQPPQIVLSGPKKVRDLSMTDIGKSQDEAGKMRQVQNSLSTFQDAYGGYTVPGSSSVALGAGRLGLTGPETKKAAEWWAGYDRYKNVARNELFGSTLTPGETAAFAATDVTPDMAPDVIRNNLTRQSQLVSMKMAQKINAAIVAGYDPDAVLASYGMTMDQVRSGLEMAKQFTGQPKGGAVPPPGPPGAQRPGAASLPRPAGMDDASLIAQARAAAQKNPAAAEEIMRRLNAWGVRGLDGTVR